MQFEALVKQFMLEQLELYGNPRKKRGPYYADCGCSGTFMSPNEVRKLRQGNYYMDWSEVFDDHVETKPIVPPPDHFYPIRVITRTEFEISPEALRDWTRRILSLPIDGDYVRELVAKEIKAYEADRYEPMCENYEFPELRGFNLVGSELTSLVCDRRCPNNFYVIMSTIRYFSAFAELLDKIRACQAREIEGWWARISYLTRGATWEELDEAL